MGPAEHRLGAGALAFGDGAGADPRVATAVNSISPPGNSRLDRVMYAAAG